MCVHRWIPVLVLAAVAIAPVASAEIALQPGPETGKDAWVRSGFPDVNNGNDTSLYFGGDPTFDEERHLYLEFDLTGFGPGTVVSTARIEFYMYGQNGFMPYMYGVYPVLGNWDEQTITWNAAPAVATDTAVEFDGTEWQGNWDQWHVIAGLADLVQSWIDTPEANHGIMIRAIATYYGEPYIYSSDSDQVELRPRLVVDGQLVANGDRSWGHVKALYRAAR